MTNLSRSRITLALNILTSCLIAAVFVFFISVLAGVDLKKNQEVMNRLKSLAEEISAELDYGIDRRIMRLGEKAPTKSPKQFYCEYVSKQLFDLYYLVEKEKIISGTQDVVEFDKKTSRILTFASQRDLKSLVTELKTATQELRVALESIKKTHQSYIRQRIAYLVLYIVFCIILFFVLFQRHRINSYIRNRRSGKERRLGIDRRIYNNPNYKGPERRSGKDRRLSSERRTQ
jgi:predicted PurR-regulated permease PerM